VTSVELRDVQRSVGRFTLGPISLTLPDSGVVGLVGANGAGKSTLMRLLATIDRPDSGTLAWNGAVVSSRTGRMSYRTRLGFVPQDVALPQRARCDDYLWHAAWLKRLPAGDRRAAVEKALAAVSLIDRATEKVQTLSGGMQRRLSLAQALLGDPGLLLLDEPTVGLDPQQRVSFRDLIREAGRSAPVLLATHLTEDVRLIAQTIVVLHEGSVLFQGPVAELEALATPDAPGDSELERGLSTLIADTGTDAETRGVRS